MISLNFQSMHIVFFRESSKIKRTECTLKFIHYRCCTNQLGIPFADRLLHRRLPRELSKKWAGRDTSKNSLVRKLTNYVDRSVARARINRIEWEWLKGSGSRLRDWRSSDQSERGNSKRPEKTRKRTTRRESTNSRDAAIRPRLQRFSARRKVQLFRIGRAPLLFSTILHKLFAPLIKLNREGKKMAERARIGREIGWKSVGKLRWNGHAAVQALPRFSTRPSPPAVNHASNFAGLLHPAE